MKCLIPLFVSVVVAAQFAYAIPARPRYVPIEPERPIVPAQRPTTIREPGWSHYGVLHETDHSLENGQPIHAMVGEDGKLVTFVSTEPGKSLQAYLGRKVAVFGPTVNLPQQGIHCVLATHVAVP